MNQRRLFQSTINTTQRLREKNDLYTPSRLEQHIKASGSVDSEMDTVLKFGQMGLGMRDNGRITEHMAMENLYMWMETSMKVTGSMTRRMDSEFTSM